MVLFHGVPCFDHIWCNCRTQTPQFIKDHTQQRLSGVQQKSRGRRGKKKKLYPKCFCLSSNKYRLNMKVANLSKLEFKPYMATYIRMLRKNVIGSSVWSFPLHIHQFGGMYFEVQLLWTKISCEKHGCDNELLFSSSILSASAFWEGSWGF